MASGMAQSLRAEMKKLGIIHVRADYNGGNDEGWIEPITITLDGGAEHEYSGYEVRDEPYFEIYRLISQPIEDRFGGFDGEPEVSGHCSFGIDDSEIFCTGDETAWVPTTGGYWGGDPDGGD